MLFCISPYLTGLAGFGISAVTVGVFLLLQRQGVELPDAEDPDAAGRELTMKLRQPVRYHVARWFRRA